jgi:putative nucleotidyltransferase with HDIG domain
MTQLTKSSPKERKFATVLFFIIGTSIVVLALLLPSLSRSMRKPPETGDVASQDYRAPQAITYTSDVLTERQRDAAESAVQPIYTSPDTSIARHQLEKIRATLAYITSVREDPYATQEQKQEDLAALEDIHLSQESVETILGLTDARWQAIQQETIEVLERVMSSPIRPETVDDARERVPALVSLTLPENQAAIVAELASAYVTANSEYSEELTTAARENARESVEPVTRSFAVGQTVALRGEILNEEDIEALQELHLIQPRPEWQDLMASIILAVVLSTLLTIYIYRQRDLYKHGSRSTIVVVTLFLAILLLARSFIPSHTVIPYLFPVAVYSLTVATLFSVDFAIITTIPLVIMVTYGMPNALDLAVYYLLGATFGVLSLGRARRMLSFFGAGTAIALVGIAVILVYRLTQPAMDLIGLITLAVASLFNGMATASITLILSFFLAQILNITTPFQLMDLTRPDHPLLQLLLHNAPGTYQHSLQVVNLAEQAAEQIGADPLLTRVGALYHDVGKALNPAYFIENQIAGFPNPHDELSPEESAAKIIQHVPDGMALARKFKLPKKVSDFIEQHHGTMITRYQYVKAVEAAGGDKSKVDIEKYRYPGPKPQSRETAILMLADGSEARVRAERPLDEESLRTIVKKVIDDRLRAGQLDDTDITLRDLNVILESFTHTLRGIHHPRVKYPELKSGEASKMLPEPKTTPIGKVTEPNNEEKPQEAPLESASTGERP